MYCIRIQIYVIKTFFKKQGNVKHKSQGSGYLRRWNREIGLGKKTQVVSFSEAGNSLVLNLGREFTCIYYYASSV